MMRTFFERRLRGGQNDTAALDAGIEGVTGAKSQFAADRAGENDLPFGGELGLHGKTILPDSPTSGNEGPSSERR
jgi:hypothetical protein